MANSTTFDEHYFSILKVLKEPNTPFELLQAKIDKISLREKKIPVDSALRESVLSSLQAKDYETTKRLLKTALTSALTDICSSSVPFLLFADVFTTSPLHICEELFPFLELTILDIKELSIFAAGRNTLLRTCNDLLKRLSKSQDTAFCGRIQLFLTKLFPIDEKSGLNIMSNFNLEKEVAYSENPDAEFLESNSMTVEFYQKFWSLQDYFKNPVQCYDSKHWKSFQGAIDQVLATFSSLKICHFNEDKNVLSKANSAMYLTSEMLIHLQLMDMNFRRNILVQMLIIFQYLIANVKFKTQDQTLSEEQKKWVMTKNNQVLNQLENSKNKKCQNQETFLGTVSHILDKEYNWNEWKNSSCPSIVKKPRSTEKPAILRKRKINPLVDRSGRKIFRFGNKSLDALSWNTSDHHLDNYRNRNQIFEMSLEEYFEDAILELDPKEKVDEEYRRINKEEWTWRSLRYLSKKSSHSLASEKPGITLKEFFTHILTNVIGKDNPEPEENLKESSPTPTPVQTAKTKTSRSEKKDPATSSRPKNKSKESKKLPPSRSSMDDISSAEEVDTKPPKPLPKQSSKSKNVEMPPSFDDTDGEADDISDEEDD